MLRQRRLSGRRSGLPLRREQEAEPDRIRIEIEDRADTLEGVRPVWLLREQPLLRLAESTLAMHVRRNAVSLDAANRIVENSNHQPVLRRQLLWLPKMLRRQDQIGFAHSLRNPR